MTTWGSMAPHCEANSAQGQLKRFRHNVCDEANNNSGAKLPIAAYGNPFLRLNRLANPKLFCGHGLSQTTKHVSNIAFQNKRFSNYPQTVACVIKLHNTAWRFVLHASWWKSAPSIEAR